jgi:hypothetical protein
MTTPNAIHASASAAGVDLAGGWASVVLATRGRGGPAFTVLADGAAELSPELRQRLDRLAASGAWTVGALAVHETFLRRLTAPFPSIAKARRVFPSLLDIQLPFPLESCSCAYLDAAATPDRQVSALAVAARREDVARALERFGAAGVDPVRLDHEGVALWVRSTRELPLAHQAARVVIYLGTDRTSYVTGRGRTVLAASGVRFGARDFLDPARGADALRHLAARLTPWLRAQDVESAQWAWAGPGAAQPELVAAIRRALSLPEETSFFVHQQPASFLARALAARAIAADPLSCNLRLGDQEHPRHRAAVAAGIRRGVGLALAASLAVVAVNVAWLSVLQQRRDALQQQVQALARSLAGAERVPRGQEVLTAERALQERAPLFEPFHRALAPSLLHQLGPLLDTAAAQQMTLSAVALRPQALECSGTAADWAHCELIQTQLAQAGWKPELERRDAGADERVHFTIKATR